MTDGVHDICCSSLLRALPKFRLRRCGAMWFCGGTVEIASAQVIAKGSLDGVKSCRWGAGQSVSMSLRIWENSTNGKAHVILFAAYPKCSCKTLECAYKHIRFLIFLK